jgi:hypothetical protein
LDCLEPTHNAGISIPLLSVSLATLMALFRFSDVASNVAVDDLTSLIRETATILLDPRFSAQSDLDDATCAQMAKAINKSAVNAATGAPRHVSIQALIAVQQQLALDAIDSYSEHAKDFNGRLSRVISRLFFRVLKAEESADSPYANIDMESIVCVMEDTLEGCRINSIDACKEMVSTLVESILKVQKSADSLRTLMGAVGISTATSSLALLISSLAPGESAPSASVAQYINTVPEATYESPKGPSVADLVTALGNSREGPAREAALADLRSHKDEFGTDELDAYLQEVSPAFRSFIEEQLASGVASPSNSENSSSMSERLKKLRTRLQATELAVKTAVEETDPRPSKPRTFSVPSINTASSISRPPSRLAQPSPSKASRSQASRSRLAQPSPSKAARSVQGNRERLAMLSAIPPVQLSGSASRSTSRANAAADLRARLEAVKQGQK